VIIAVPVAARAEFHALSSAATGWRPPPAQPSQVVWWHWDCTTCGRISLPRFMASSALGALQMGDHHARREQCREGQLDLFGGPP
jgi:hypothetical protein